MDGEVKFYLDKIEFKIDEASEKILMGIAHQIEAEAKNNVELNKQWDTGFMVNSIHVVSETENNYAAAHAAAKSKNPKAEMAPLMAVKKGQVAVVAGANYSIYQETRNSFLFKAGEQVAGQVTGAIVEKVGREVLKD